jgi:hypothetical protein
VTFFLNAWSQQQASQRLIGSKVNGILDRVPGAVRRHPQFVPTKNRMMPPMSRGTS